jgi:hypothetical protein
MRGLADGTKYVGEWKGGYPHGQGTWTYPNGNKYVGEFKDGEYDGQGTHTYPDGGTYVGEFKDNKMHGQGTYTYPDGEKYVGEYKDDKRNGQGTYTFADGTKYVGEWKDGNRNGQGTYTYASGSKYVGEWKNDKEWEGIEYRPSGEIWGTYSNSKWCVGCTPTARQLAIVREIESSQIATTPKPESESPSLQLAGTGTAFVVSKNYLLTASHVIDECLEVSVRHAHEDIDTIIAAWDETNDLGLLKSEKSFQHIAKFRGGKPIRLGDTVVNYGYPLFGELSDHAKISKGEINSLAGMGNDSSVFQYDAPTQPGNSGGPVLDLSGNVVGIVSSGLSKRYADATGHIAQNVNFAVKSLLAEGFLSANGVDFEKVESLEKLETADIAEKAERFTVLVGCWQ